MDACLKNCIDLDMPDEVVDLEVGAVICATGIDYYDPREASEYGYTRFQNVVNSIELERVLSPGGPPGQVPQLAKASASGRHSLRSSEKVSRS